MIDTTNGFAYFGAYTGPGVIVKVRLSDFTPVDALVLNTNTDAQITFIRDANGVVNEMIIEWAERSPPSPLRN